MNPQILVHLRRDLPGSRVTSRKARSREVPRAAARVEQWNVERKKKQQKSGQRSVLLAAMTTTSFEVLDEKE